MNPDQVNQIAFQLILHAGNGRSYSLEAIQAAKKGDFGKAADLLKAAGEELAQAHQSQTSLVQMEAGGQHCPINLLLIHAQDHLMTAMAIRDLATEIVELYQKK